MTKKQIYTAELFFVRALLPYTAGISCAWYFANGAWFYGLILLVAVLFTTMLFMQAFYGFFELYNNKGLTGLVAALFLFACGGVNCMRYQDRYQRDHFANSNCDFLKVRIIDDPQIKNNSLRCKATVMKGYIKSGRMQLLTGNLTLYIMQPEHHKLQRYTYGTEIIIPARYERIVAPQNPGEFDYQFLMSTHNIQHQSFLHEKHIEVLPANNGNKLIKFAFDLRFRQVEYFKSILDNNEAFALASTLILGSRSDLSIETLDIYSKTGTIHALSVSGMHVGLIYLVISWMLQFLNRKRSLLVLQMILILMLVWLYALVTGFSASVLRSTIMLSVFLIAKTFSRQSNSYNILAFTAFCLLIYNPLYLWDVGFQLSFLAVFGLISLQPKLQYSFYIKSVWLQKLWNLTAISLAAQIATFPLSIYYFHQFPIYFIFSNLFITLPIALLMYLGLIILMLKLDWLGPVFEYLICFMNNGLEWITELPLSNVTGIWINKTEFALLSLTVIFFCLAFGNKDKKMLMIGMFSLLIYKGMTGMDELLASRQEKQINFKLRGHRARAHIKGYSALLITDLKPADKLYKYSIQPALGIHHIRKLKILHPDTLRHKK